MKLAQLESSYELKLVFDLVVVHTLCYLSLLGQFYELREDVLTFGAVTRKLVVSVALKNVCASFQK